MNNLDTFSSHLLIILQSVTRSGIFSRAYRVARRERRDTQLEGTLSRDTTGEAPVCLCVYVYVYTCDVAVSYTIWELFSRVPYCEEREKGEGTWYFFFAFFFAGGGGSTAYHTRKEARTAVASKRDRMSTQHTQE